MTAGRRMIERMRENVRQEKSFAFGALVPDGADHFMEMSSRQVLSSIDQALDEVARRLASGELDQSGRYYTDEELAAGAATGRTRTSEKPAKAPAA